MFKRSKPATWAKWARQLIYPKGGFKRAVAYLWHRLRRLPDPPHRIARGVFVGIFANFPPIFFGIQMPVAALLAWALRGNVLAAVLGTLLSNPITTPIIALVSLNFGHWMLGTSDSVSINGVFAAFAAAGQDLWHNLLAAFSDETSHWEGLILFWQQIYFPYLIGSILPGLATSALFAWISVPLVTAAQALRRKRLNNRSLARKPRP